MIDPFDTLQDIGDELGRRATVTSQKYTEQAYRDKLNADLRLQVEQANINARLTEAKRQAVKDCARCFFRCSATVGVAYIASEMVKWWASR